MTNVGPCQENNLFFLFVNVLLECRTQRERLSLFLDVICKSCGCWVSPFIHDCSKTPSVARKDGQFLNLCQVFR